MSDDRLGIKPRARHFQGPKTFPVCAPGWWRRTMFRFIGWLDTSKPEKVTCERCQAWLERFALN